MRKIYLYWVVFVGLFTLALMPIEAKNKRVVMLALDGVSVEGFKQAHTPNLDKLLAEGALSLTTRVVMPSMTQANWTSQLTGSGPEQHGVYTNDWQLDKAVLPPVDKDEKGYYPSLFKVLKDNVKGMKTAFCYNWGNLINPYNKDYLDAVIYDEDGTRMPYCDKAFDFIIANRDQPMVVFLYTGHTDIAGHTHKWMSPEYLKAIEEADGQIGAFLDKMDQEGLLEDTYFMLLSDHGGLGYEHGGMTVDEMIVPWGIVGPRIKKGFEIKEPNNTVNTASVILKLFNVKQPLCWTGEVPMSIFR